MKKIDPFKIIGILLLAWIALSVHNYSQNGRYKGSGYEIFDTRTGSSYQLQYDKLDIKPRRRYKGFEGINRYINIHWKEKKQEYKYFDAQGNELK